MKSRWLKSYLEPSQIVGIILFKESYFVEKKVKMDLEEDHDEVKYGSRRHSVITYSPVEIEYKGFKFLITMKPTDATIIEYLKELKRHHVSAIVKLCEEGYNTRLLEENGIVVLDLSFEDGKSPPNEIIDEWFKVLKNQFEGNRNACIAVHCVSGLGRAPVMVAIALIELGMKYIEAVELIREKRRGAINSKQLSFLEKYKRRHRLDEHKKSCVIQ